MHDRTVGAAYDAIAPEYDRQLEQDAWMRAILWKRYLAAFRPWHRVLDVGCGTGTDAVFLASRGIQVTAIDISPAMIDRLNERVARQGLSEMVRAEVLSIAELATLPAGHFDGVISSFAALSALPTLDQFANDAALLLQPHGTMILHLLNGSSLWEWAGLMARGRREEAHMLNARRERTFNVGDQPVTHYLPRADEAYKRYFRSSFRLVGVQGLGITRPPRVIPHVPGAALAILARLDERIGTHRPFVDWGRFVVMEMRKR